MTTPNLTFISTNTQGEYFAYHGVVDIKAERFELLPEPITPETDGPLEEFVNRLRAQGREIESAKARDGSAFLIAKAPEVVGDLKYWYRIVIRTMTRAHSARSAEARAKALRVSLKLNPLQWLMLRLIGSR